MNSKFNTLFAKKKKKMVVNAQDHKKKFLFIAEQDRYVNINDFV